MSEIKNPTRGMKVTTQPISGRQSPYLPECELNLHRENGDGIIFAIIVGFNRKACLVKNEDSGFVGAYWLDELELR